jgi:hypothetical protein
MHEQAQSIQLRLYAFALLALSLAPAAHAANPLIPAGDLSLRHDIQLLADAGIVRGPVTSWPLAWEPILADINRTDNERQLTYALSAALTRVRLRASWETRSGELQYRAGLAAAENPTRIRSFADTPRESGEVTAGLSWIGERFSVELNGQATSSPDDGEEFRADGSHIALILGNYAIAASTLDRWWGPGWDGSLILSSNARPIPAVTIDRSFTEPFATRWLSWIGPWDVSVLFGRMESDREVADAQIFGFRFNFRPIPSLEIGLSRTAQWCGEGRPCDLGTFGDLLIGRDNRGGSGIDIDNEPGNQLAGLDFRWALTGFGIPVAVYGEFIGEDEAGGFPSKFLGQGGIEASGTWRDRWSWRGFSELAITKCRFYQSDADYNCAYNHSIYRTGYRYRGRSVGHGGDNDARILSAGLILVDEADTQWQLLARFGELNRGGAPDARNTLTPTPQDIASLDLSHSRVFRFGVIDIGAGYERIDDTVSGQTDNDVRAFIQWRTTR